MTKKHPDLYTSGFPWLACLSFRLELDEVSTIFNKRTLGFYLIIRLNFKCSGASETQVFKEQSPSGNDYLAEVNKKIFFKKKKFPSI